MTDADALLDAIEANSADDTPRLVFADWLEETGHAEYAAFIRVSCRLARYERMSRGDRGRLREERHRAYEGMLRSSSGLFGWHQYRGGYGGGFDTRGIPVAEAVVSAEEFVRHSPGWGPLFRPRRLTLRDATGHEAGIAAAPTLARVDTLTVDGTFIQMRYDDRWREIDEFDPVSAELLHALADGRAAPQLTALRIGPLAVTAAELAAFAESPLAARLNECYLTIRMPDGGLEELRSAGWHPAMLPRAVDRFLVEHRFRLPE